MFITLIFTPTRKLEHLRRLYICGVLTMAKLARPLMGVKDTGKARNWQVQKSQFFLLLSKSLFKTAHSWCWTLLYEQHQQIAVVR